MFVMVDLSTLFARRVDLEPLAGDIDRQLADVPDKPAVFLLADGDDRPILLATGLAVRTILRRRLGEPLECEVPNAKCQVKGTRRADLRPLVRRLYLHPTFSPFETDLSYLWLARQLFPDRYRQMIRPRHCWMLHDQSGGPIPRLAITDRFTPPGPRVGPISDRQSASRLLDLLTWLFELCHDYQVLRQAPHGRPCEYKEMGRCSGPCDGTISLAAYRVQVSAAADFAADRGRAWRASQAERMKQAAARLDFEQAARTKDRLARAAELDNPRFRWLAPMDQCNFLVVQRGPAKAELRTFRAFAGGIVPGPAIKRSDPAAGLADWLSLAAPPDDPQLRAEEAGLLADYLFRGENIPGRPASNPPFVVPPSGGPIQKGHDAPAIDTRRGLFVRYTGQPLLDLAAAVAAAFPPTVRKKSKHPPG
jgi:hypothetical protein